MFNWFQNLQSDPIPSNNYVEKKIKLPYQLDHLKIIHNQLLHYQLLPESQIVELLRTLSEYVIYSDQNTEAEIFFDYFCENNILALFVSIAEYTTNSIIDKRYILIQIQLLQTLSIIIQNIKNQTSLYYILSNNYINRFIQCNYTFSEDEIRDYYISCLKTLSLKLNKDTIQFFFNTQLHENNKMSFPLYVEASKFITCKENMIRIAVKTLTLNIFRIPDDRMRQFITNEKNKYILEQLVNSGKDIAFKLQDIYDQNNIINHFDSIAEEYIDYYYYLQDIFDIGIPELGYKLGEIIYNKIIQSFLTQSLLMNETSSSHKLSKLIAINLLSLFFSIIKYTPLLNATCFLLFSLEYNEYYSYMSTSLDLDDRKETEKMCNNNLKNSNLKIQMKDCNNQKRIQEIHSNDKQQNNHILKNNFREIFFNLLQSNDHQLSYASLSLISCVMNNSNIERTILNEIRLISQKRKKIRQILLTVKSPKNASLTKKSFFIEDIKNQQEIKINPISDDINLNNSKEITNKENKNNTFDTMKYDILDVSKEKNVSPVCNDNLKDLTNSDSSIDDEYDIVHEEIDSSFNEKSLPIIEKKLILPSMDTTNEYPNLIYDKSFVDTLLQLLLDENFTLRYINVELLIHVFLNIVMDTSLENINEKLVIKQNKTVNSTSYLLPEHEECLILIMKKNIEQILNKLNHSTMKEDIIDIFEQEYILFNEFSSIIKIKQCSVPFKLEIHQMIPFDVLLDKKKVELIYRIPQNELENIQISIKDFFLFYKLATILCPSISWSPAQLDPLKIIIDFLQMYKSIKNNINQNDFESSLLSIHLKGGDFLFKISGQSVVPCMLLSQEKNITLQKTKLIKYYFLLLDHNFFILADTSNIIPKGSKYVIVKSEAPLHHVETLINNSNKRLLKLFIKSKKPIRCSLPKISNISSKLYDINDSKTTTIPGIWSLCLIFKSEKDCLRAKEHMEMNRLRIREAIYHCIHNTLMNNI